MKTLAHRLKCTMVVVTLAAVLGACVGPPMRVTTLTDVEIDYSRGRTVLATACGFQLLLLIPIMTNERAERAYQKLRREAGESNYIADVRVRERWYYGLVGTAYCTELEGTAYPHRTSMGGDGPM